MPLTTEQEEQNLRKEVLRNDQLVRQQAAGHGTFFSHAIAESEAIGGRFAAVGKSAVVGATPGPIYPQLPADSPAAIPWPEGEDVYGVPIDQMEPVGSEAEQLEAQRILDQRLAAPPASGDADDGPVALPSTVDLSASPTNSPDGVGIGPATGGVAVSEAGATPPSLSQPLAALQSTPATRAPASEEVQRGAGARPFQRRL
jgi:hypothetical protein